MKLATKAILAPLVLITLLIKTMPEAKAEQFDVKAFLNNVHVRVGVAYKIKETNLYFAGVPMRKALTARLGAWYRFNKVGSKHCSVDLGIDHHSQYSENAPFNDRPEYSKFELFLDGTCTLGVFYD